MLWSWQQRQDNANRFAVRIMDGWYVRQGLEFSKFEMFHI